MKASRTASSWNWVIPAFCALVLAASVRSWSLWIDEGQTFGVVGESWSHMLDAVFNRGDAVSGMPLYFVAEFFWCKMFGTGEYAMRSMNLVFAAVALLGARRLVRDMGLPAWSLLFPVLNPVFLYYMNEARPYVALYACGMWAFVFLSEYFRDWRRRSLLAFALCMWLGCALHMMFAFMGVAYAVLVAFCFRDGRLRIRDHILVWLWVVPLFLPLAFHYLRFVANAPELDSAAPQPLSGIAQIGYCFAGFGGLGWSRNALRARQFGLTWRMLAEMGMALAAWISLGILSIRTGVFKDRTVIRLLAAVLVALTCFIAVNVLLGTRFWERHVIFLLPAFSIVLARVCAGILATAPSRAGRAAVGVFLAAYLLSGLNTVAMDYYQKDDYRGALRLARSMAPDHVFFQGCHVTFGYYGLGAAWNVKGGGFPDELAGNADISGATPGQLSALLDRSRGKVVLILSEKPDFDSGGLYGRLVHSGLPVQSVNAFAVAVADSAVREALVGPPPRQCVPEPSL